MAFSHGTQDAQKTMGVITLALVTTGHLDGFNVPTWVILLAAGAMGLGHARGRLAGHPHPRQPHHRTGSAQGVRGADRVVHGAARLGLRVCGPGLLDARHDHLDHGRRRDRRLSAVRWSVARQVGTAWVLTIPGAALSAFVVYLVANTIVG